MIANQTKIDQLEALANECELIAYLACDDDMWDHNKRLALELREAALRFRSRNAIAAESVRSPQLAASFPITGYSNATPSRSNSSSQASAES